MKKIFIIYFGFLKALVTNKFTRYLIISNKTIIYIVEKNPMELKRFKGHHQMTCTRESITYIDFVFMELQQLLKEPQVHEHPAWPASIRLWQLSCKTYRLIGSPPHCNYLRNYGKMWVETG